MWMSRGHGATPAAPMARERSLYRAWTEAPAAVMAQLGGDVFSLAEAGEMAAWGAAQAAWGLSLRLRRDSCGAARLAEIVGPDGCAPLALLYRGADHRLRVDDFAGDVRACASLAEALGMMLECV